MKVISLINYKGGVGKTTLTANVGAQLAKTGLRVLNIVTRTAIAASNYILVPTKADYLSTIGFENLLRSVGKFEAELNGHRKNWPKKEEPVSPQITPLLKRGYLIALWSTLSG